MLSTFHDSFSEQYLKICFFGLHIEENKLKSRSKLTYIIDLKGDWGRGVDLSEVTEQRFECRFLSQSIVKLIALIKVQTNIYI